MNHTIHCAQRSVIRFFFLLLMILSICLASKPVKAQGMPMFTNPIGSKQLMKYADRLELTVEQRLALEPMHDSYFQIFRALRDEDMQEFIDILYDTMTGFVRNGFAIPQRDSLEKIVRGYQKIEKKIAATDKSLFNEIESLLDENQHIRLERVRKQRKLDVLRKMALEIGGEFNPGAQIDLTQYVETLDISNQEKALVDPILISYESTLLAKARKLRGAIIDITVTILDAIDEMGLRDLEPQELMQLGNDEEFQLSIQTMFDEASIEFQEATSELSKLNLKTLRKVLLILESQNKHDLRDKYYQRVYGRVYSGTREWKRRYDDALKLKSLPPELIEPLTQTRDNTATQQDVLIEKLVDAVEKSREYRTMDILNNNNSGPQKQKIEELQSQSGSLAVSALQQLESMLGPELYAELRNEKEASNKVLEQVVSVNTDGRVVTQTQLAQGTSSHADRLKKDQYLPDPVSPYDFKQYASMLQFETEDQFIVDILYQEYRENYDKLLYKPLHDDADENDNQETEETENKASDDELRQLRIDELHQIDNRLFSDVALIIKSQKQNNTQKRLHLLRTRTIYRKLAQTYSPSWRTPQATTDLVHLLMNSQIDGLEFEDLNAIFESYESQTLPLLINRYEIARKSKRRMDSWRKATQASASQAVSQRMMDNWQELQQSLAKNHVQLAQISEEHLDQIKSQLPINVAQQLQYSYYETVYPEMYRDSRDIDRVIVAVLSMPSISDTQLIQVNAIADKFHDKYMQLAEQSINLQRELDNDRGNFSMGIPSHEVVMRELKRELLEYERDEACQRAMMHLQLTLGETQRLALQEMSK